MILWSQGRLIPASEAGIAPGDRGFTLGDGLYETIRVRGGDILRLDRHFARLASGLDLLAFPLQVDETRWEAAMRVVLGANGLRDAVLRMTVSRGVAARGMAPDPDAKPTVVISAAPFAPPGSARIVIAESTRRNEHSPLSRIKSTSCLDSIVARIEATRRAADDAILLNTAGRVAEATAANIFAVINGTLATPPLADGALPGVMRNAILEAMPVAERSLSPADLTSASEIFLTSSLGIRPVIALGDLTLPIGPVAAALISRF